jgi:hypothetical protein
MSIVWWCVEKMPLFSVISFGLFLMADGILNYLMDNNKLWWSKKT